LVLPSLDPDTPRGIAQALHGAWTPFRAAESGLPIIRSEITAWSQVTDARGRMIAEAPPGQGVVITGAIRPGQRWTFYRLAGDWFLGLAVVLALLGTRRDQISADASGNLP
jgi:apolipoprotein N-acyltransferase